MVGGTSTVSVATPLRANPATFVPASARFKPAVRCNGTTFGIPTLTDSLQASVSLVVIVYCHPGQ